MIIARPLKDGTERYAVRVNNTSHGIYATRAAAKRAEAEARAGSAPISETKLARPAAPLADRFWAKVHRRGPEDCWPWRASVAGWGYGRLRYQRDGVWVTRSAHRVAWELTHGQPPPDHLAVLHRCDNPRCVNPAHLLLGTQQDNLADMRAKGRDRPWGQ